MSVDTSTIIQREAPDIEAMKLALMQAGIDLTKTGMTLPQQQVAGLSGLQEQAAQYAGEGIGSYMPFMAKRLTYTNNLRKNLTLLLTIVLWIRMLMKLYNSNTRI